MVILSIGSLKDVIKVCLSLSMVRNDIMTLYLFRVRRTSSLDEKTGLLQIFAELGSYTRKYTGVYLAVYLFGRNSREDTRYVTRPCIGGV